MTFTGKIIRLAAAVNEYLKLDERPQINGNKPMEMDQEGRTKLKELVDRWKIIKEQSPIHSKER
ncbi:hypothetical protein M513_09066 [Trichuris suis]|uniref:Uncharacterized protein n=1 Tax=Trichuris suis TaxID=68888 RepID=A0A085LYR0_9BILA|nr:hypothetical protein M513_09066 [Trichuris suis]